jgi:methionyl aminopeptidase
MNLNYKETFEKTKIAGSIAAGALDEVYKIIKPGITTGEIDNICYEYINDHKAYSAPLFYRGFPKSCCTSTNHIVCHGIPSNKILKEGDIVNVDVTAFKEGWHGDTSRMFYVGKVKLKAQKLVETTYEAMMRGIEVVKPGNTTGDIGNAIQSFAEKKNYSVVRDFCGHGLGKVFHDQPSILHFGKPGEGVRLEKGMFFTVEPMINIGGYKVKILDDGWTAVTCDKSLSAQFEHSIGVTNYGYEIFTKSKKNLLYPPY